MTRRLRTYRIIQNEPSVTDHVIKEGWYNLQDFRMSNIADNAKLGDCGTYYPIVLNSEFFLLLLNALLVFGKAEAKLCSQIKHYVFQQR